MADLTFAGFAYDKDNVLVPAGTKYQGLFIKVNSDSTPTAYSSVRTIGSDSYYSIDLGDGDWLGTEARWGAGDIVILMYWLPSSLARTSDSLEQFANRRYTIHLGDNGAVDPQNVRLLANLDPTADFTLPTIGYVDTPVNVTNTSSDTPHPTPTVGGTQAVTMYQEYRYSGNSVFPVSRVIQSDWDWQFVPNPGTDLESNNSTNLTHTWSNVGDYLVQLIATDASLPTGGTDTVVKPIRIVYRPPVPDFVFAPYPVGVNVDITFTETITDIDNRVGTNTAFPGVSYKWYVDNNDGSGFVYQAGFDNIDLIRDFTTNGQKWARLEVYWNDGFDNHISQVTKPLFISNTPPIADFDIDGETKCSIDYTFTSDSRDPDGTIVYYDWYIYSLPGVSLLAQLGGSSQTVFTYAITEVGSYRIVLTVTDNDGASDTKTMDFTVDEIDCGGGGQTTVSSTMWTPGGAGVPWWCKKPMLRAELLSEKDGESERVKIDFEGMSVEEADGEMEKIEIKFKGVSEDDEEGEKPSVEAKLLPDDS